MSLKPPAGTNFKDRRPFLGCKLGCMKIAFYDIPVIAKLKRQERLVQKVMRILRIEEGEKPVKVLALGLRKIDGILVT